MLRRLELLGDDRKRCRVSAEVRPEAGGEHRLSAHRMPQQREVTVHRVLVPDTVEDRICQIQDKKREMIDTALDEKSSKSLTRLGARELRFIFGMNN